MPKPTRKSKGKYAKGNIKISIQGGYYYITSDCCLGLVLSEKELNDLEDCIKMMKEPN